MHYLMLTLIFFVRGMTRFAPFGIVRVSFFGEILLRGYREDEFLSTFTADEDPRLKTALH
jgi:hypothetical protein